MRCCFYLFLYKLGYVVSIVVTKFIPSHPHKPCHAKPHSFSVTYTAVLLYTCSTVVKYIAPRYSDSNRSVLVTRQHFHLSSWFELLKGLGNYRNWHLKASKFRHKREHSCTCAIKPLMPSCSNSKCSGRHSLILNHKGIYLDTVSPGPTRFYKHLKWGHRRHRKRWFY